MSDPQLGLAPGDFAWIAANSGLNQPESPLIVPSWTISKGKMAFDLPIAAPARFSWRRSPSLAPVSNQGKNATCVAHATCRMIETRVRQSGTPLSLSAECAHKCVYGYPCSWPASEVSSLLDALRAHGAPQAPGFLANDACPSKAAMALIPVPRFKRAETVAQVKAQIAFSGPVLGILTLGLDFESLASPFVYGGAPGDGTDFNHAVMFIGYDDSDQGGMWQCQNSFGSGWGDEGCFLIPYAAADLLGDDLHAAYYLV